MNRVGCTPTCLIQHRQPIEISCKAKTYRPFAGVVDGVEQRRTASFCARADNKGVQSILPSPVLQARPASVIVVPLVNEPDLPITDRPIVTTLLDIASAQQSARDPSNAPWHGATPENESRLIQGNAVTT